MDEIDIDMPTTGRQERLISGDMDQDFQDLEFVIELKGIFEQVGASNKSANQLWLDLIGGAEVTFKSDTDDSTSYIVVPDLKRSFKVKKVSKGTHKESVQIPLISKSVYQEDDSVSTGVADMRPHYGA